jgi:uncharacterized membrane protein YgcG
MLRAFLLLVFLAFSAPVFGYDFVIKEHDVTIKVLKDSSFEVTERYIIDYATPMRGVILEIPYIYSEGSEKGTAKRPNVFGGRYKTIVTDIKTDSAEMKVSSNGAYKEVRLGTPDVRITGEKEYIVTYKVFGAVNFFESSSEIYWNIHGIGWSVPVERVTFQIILPEPIDIPAENIFVYTGNYGSTDKSAEYTLTSAKIYGHSTRMLYPNEGLTVGLLLPEGYLSYGSPLLRLKLFVINNLYLLALLGYLPALFMLWFTKGRDSKSPIMTLYEPPKGVDSAVAGAIEDDSIDNRDLISLILRWAALNIIRIEEIEEKALIRTKIDYTFVKLKELPDNMANYEHTMFNGMFSAGETTKKLSELKNNYYKTIAEARAMLDKEIDSKELYEGDSRLLSGTLKAISIILAFLGVFLTAFTGDVGWFVSCTIMTIATLITSKIMPKKSNKGQQLYSQIAGFKEFIKRAEKDKLERMLEDNPEYFNITVPYAVSFGLLEGWAKKFDGLMSSPPEWYVPRAGNAFNMAYFASALNNGVSAMNSTMTSQPAPQGGAGGGRSGFGGGGGGFSGGGFGGGGGRGW